MNLPTNSDSTRLPPGLPPVQAEVLAGLVAAAQESFGDDLISVILFGSGAEGRLRATSDLNLMVVLRAFQRDRVDRFREPLRLAAVAVKAETMFVLLDELPVVAEAFAAKFDDIVRRHRVLVGQDVIRGLSIPPAAKKRRLRQMLLNLRMRLRERYAVVSLRDEQLALVVADAAGPLRAAAATLLELEGADETAPKEALERIAREECPADADATLASLSQVRESRQLPAGEAGAEVFRLKRLIDRLMQRLDRLDRAG